MKTIPLTQGKEAIVDDCDYDELMKSKWCFSGHGYAVRMRLKNGTEEKRVVYLHRQLMGFPSGMEIDHINGNRLDNRRENLRLATRAQNQRNKGTLRNSKLGLKGVIKVGKAYRAQAWIDGRTRYIGLFKSQEEAHGAYCASASARHGEFFRAL